MQQHLLPRLTICRSKAYGAETLRIINRGCLTYVLNSPDGFSRRETLLLLPAHQCFDEVVVGIGEGDIHLAVAWQMAHAVAQDEVAVGAGWCQILFRCEGAQLSFGYREILIALLGQVVAQLNERRGDDYSGRGVA